MSNYQRSTRMCSFEELQPALQQSLQAYFSAHGLAGLETECQMCTETRSERQKTGGLGALLGDNRDQVYHLAAFLTPEWLVWARTGDHTEITVAAARLKDLRVRAKSSVLFRDTGLDIQGFVESASFKVQGFIALGSEPAAEEFARAVVDAVNTANPPRRLIDLFGGKPRS